MEISVPRLAAVAAVVAAGVAAAAVPQPASTQPPPTALPEQSDAYSLYLPGLHREFDGKPLDGHMRWRFGTGIDPETYPIKSVMLAVGDGLIYAGAGDGVLYAIDAERGHEVWRFSTVGDSRLPEFASYSVYPTVADGSVYVGASNGLVYALDAQTGAERWRVETPWVVSFPVVEDGRVFVGNIYPEMYEPGVEYTGLDPDREFGPDGLVLALDTDTGAELWRAALPHRETVPVVSEGAVYVASSYRRQASGSLHAIDAASGDELWRADTGTIHTVPHVAGNVVYVDSRGLAGHDVATGAEVWRPPSAPRGTFSFPVSARGVVAVATNVHDLYGYEVATAEERWSYETGDWGAYLNIIEGDLFVSYAWFLVRINMTTGEERWRMEFDGGLFPAVADARGVYIGCTDGYVYAIE